MRTTIKDVAQHAGVSFKTVSRVINNESGVKLELREKVLRSIETLDYRPNQSARSLRGKPSTIALIYNNKNSHYVMTVLHGILQQCREYHYELLVHPCAPDVQETVNEVKQMLMRSQIAGLVITPPLSEDASFLAKLDELKLEYVRIISSAEEPSDIERTIFINDRQAAYAMTSYLIEQGHRKIGFFNGDGGHLSSGERLLGFKQALSDNGIDINESWVLAGEYSFSSGVERLKRLSKQGEMPSALFACNDEIAAGALFAAQQLNIAVPDSLSIVGFEKSPFSEQTWPALTTVYQPMDEIACHAANILLRKLTSQQQSRRSHEYLPEIIVRDSVKNKQK